MEDFSDSYFINYKFLMIFPAVDESNWLLYFQDHPEFEASCLNLKYEQGGEKVTLQECARRNENGIFYDFQKSRGAYVISKFFLDNGRTLLLGQYYIVDNKTFTNTNLKSLLFRKVANIGSVMYDLANQMLDLN